MQGKSGDLGGRRIIKKNTHTHTHTHIHSQLPLTKVAADVRSGLYRLGSNNFGKCHGKSGAGTRDRRTAIAGSCCLPPLLNCLL